MNFDYAEDLVKKLKAKKLKISSAESFTGGLVSSLITSISGSSQIFEVGKVTYSYDAKTNMLGVSSATLQHFGAVSREVSEQMALGILNKSNSDIAIATTGCAGPKPLNKLTPVGFCYIAVADNYDVKIVEYHLKGTRNNIRLEAAYLAIDLALKFLCERNR